MSDSNAYSPSKILVVEPDEKSRTMIFLTLESHFDVTVLECETAEEALGLLKENPDIQCIVSEYRLKDQNSGEIFKHLDDHAKARFVLITHENVQKMPEFLGIGFQGYLKKPFETDDLIGMIETRLEKARSLHHFCKIKIEILQKLGAFKLDLYIKLSENKYVKVAHENERFSEEDFQKYAKKKVEYLYLKKSDALAVAKRVSSELNKAFLDQHTSFESEYQVSSAALELIRSTAQEFGFEPEIQELTQKAVERTLTNIRKNKTLFKFFSQMTAVPGNYLVDHSVMLAHITCGIAALQTWMTEITYDQLTYAAFLHDVLMKDEKMAMASDYAEFIQGGFSATEREQYLGHPEETAALVRTVYGIPPDVDTLIAQHHERPDGTGFPNHLDHTSIRPLSCVFILGHELTGFLQRGGRPEGLAEFMANLHLRDGVGHFKDVIETLEVALTRTLFMRQLES